MVGFSLRWHTQNICIYLDAIQQASKKDVGYLGSTPSMCSGTGQATELVLVIVGQSDAAQWNRSLQLLLKSIDVAFVVVCCCSVGYAVDRCALHFLNARCSP